MQFCSKDGIDGWGAMNSMNTLRLASLCDKARRVTGRFRRDTRGVTAIEFAFVIGPFLALTMGTIEVALVHLMRSSVSNAVENASRSIYTGAAGCATTQSIKTAICDRVAMQNETSCMANLKVILEELNDFDGTRTTADADFDKITDSVDPGESESRMLLRTYYKWEVMFPLLSESLGGADGVIILGASTAFKNEPFGDNAGCKS